jgi:hypothetical protein
MIKMKETILGLKLALFIVLEYVVYSVLGIVFNRYLTVDNLFTIFLVTSLASAVLSRLLEEAFFRSLRKAFATKE